MSTTTPANSGSTSQHDPLATTAVERVLEFAEVGQRVAPGEVLPGVAQLVTWDRPDDGVAEFESIDWSWGFDAVVAVEDPFPAELVGMVGDDGLPVGWRALSLEDAAVQTWNAELVDDEQRAVLVEGQPVDLDGRRAPLRVSVGDLRLGDVLEFGGWWVKVGAIGGSETLEQVVYLWVLQPDGQFSIPGADIDPITPPARPERDGPVRVRVKESRDTPWVEVDGDDQPNWLTYWYGAE